MDAHTQELIAESERLLRGEHPSASSKQSVKKPKPRVDNRKSARSKAQRRPRRRRRRPQSASGSTQSDANTNENDNDDDTDSLVYSEDESGEFYRFADDETIARERQQEAEAKQAQDALDVRQAERDAAVATIELAQTKVKVEKAQRRAKRRTKAKKSNSAGGSAGDESDVAEQKKKAARLKRNSIAELATEQKQLLEESERAKAMATKKGSKMKKPALVRPTVQGPTPPRSNGGENAALGDREWDNELARSILILYNANSINEAEMRTARTTPSSRRSQNKSFWGSNARSPKRAPSSPQHNMQSNVSLPSLPPSSAPGTQRGITSSKSTTTLQKELKQPKQIWFYGSGRLRAVWCAISNKHLRDDMHRLSGLDPTRCSHRLCRELREFEKKSKFEEYIECALNALREFSREATHDRAERRREAARKQQNGSTTSADSQEDPMALHTCDLKPASLAQASDVLEMQGTQDAYMIDYATLDPSLLADDDDQGGGLVERMMWRQLVACCNIFGTKLCDLGRFGPALQLFKQAEELLESTSALDGGAAFVGAIRTQLRAFTNDALGYYYYKRKKTNAAALYTEKAMRAHHRLQQWDHVAKCHLHCGAILALMGKHDEAIKCLAQILDMVDDERLQVGGTNAQKICMVAVCYHNIAVEQLVLRRPAEACVSSQNARRLARLSLSFANRWINWFERTHQYALQRLAAQHSYLTAGKGTPKPAVPSQHQPRSSLKNPSLQKFYGGLASALE